MEKNKKIIGILGGMGPFAGLDFLKLFLESCSEYLEENKIKIIDQNYPEHFLAQLPIPDRTLALNDKTAKNPLSDLKVGIEKLIKSESKFIAIACNTAHAWHEDLQKYFPEIEILNIAKETVNYLKKKNIKEILLFATLGTYKVGLYKKFLDEAKIECLIPDEENKEKLMQAIYKGVKQNKIDLAVKIFNEILENQQKEQNYQYVPILMACTEIPLALPKSKNAQGRILIDPAKILAKSLVLRAYQK